MPFVRYARDRRGYDTLYVMHAFEGPEKHARPRVLYAVRTVPYAKVGRMTIDESVQHRIESAYPNIAFDWPRLLKEAAQSAPRPDRAESRQEQRKGRGRKPTRTPEVRQVREVREVREVQVQVQDVPEVPETAEASVMPHAVPMTEAPREPNEPIEPEPIEPVEPNEPIEPQVPGVPEVQVPTTLFVDPSWPVVDFVGTERALILRGRYIEIAHRVISRVADPAERRRLLVEAARLNPEGWKTDEQARQGVARFEEQYSRLADQLRRQRPV